MRRLLILSAVLAAIGAAQAGSPTSNHRDYPLQPGDFAKPVIVGPLPGLISDPTRLDDPIIIIDDDGPSEEDEGIVYTGPSRVMLPFHKKNASHQ